MGELGEGKYSVRQACLAIELILCWQSMANFSQFNDESSTNYTVQHIAGITVVYPSPSQIRRSHICQITVSQCLA